MALDTNSFPSAQVTLTATDYTGSPLTVSITTLFGDVVIPLERPQESNSLMVNTSAGKSHAGEPHNGQAEPPTGSFQFYEIDTSDNAEVSAPVALFLALSANSVSGTAYSAHVFTSQLTLGGKLQVKLVFAIVNEGGVTHTITVPAVITSVVDGIANGARAITVNYKVVGAITRA